MNKRGQTSKCEKIILHLTYLLETLLKHHIELVTSESRGATKNTPNDLKQEHPHIKWRAMAGMRDILIHNYFGIDYDIVWDVIMNKMPS
ncbi:MAG: DUF86 domain-containing protein [Candidatus Omnitrophica bacterium]|nr:DUF86 domain-containing protein [Candidatus Omnitrophota bacterium]